MEDVEFDAVIQVLENPVRRRIIKRLSQGPSYPLQLSKELGLGQPLVAKHLVMMERAGLVTSTREESPGGPDRRRYALAKSVSITLDMAPNLFIQHGFSFASLKGGGLSKEATAIMDRSSKITGKGPGDVPELSTLLTQIDEKLEEVEEQRAALLYVRNLTMSTASRAIEDVGDREARRVIYGILDEHNRNVEYLSKKLDLREAVVRDILRQLQDLLE